MRNEVEKIFLLSPANLGGVRAGHLTSPGSTFAIARRFRNEGLTIEEAFCFLSSLYFRGKLAYAKRFAPRNGNDLDNVLIIAPGFGLVSPGWTVDMPRMQTLRDVRVDVKCGAYRTPLAEHAAELKARLERDARIVLLGSIATGKYIDILAPIFGERLLAPQSFVGIGDMSRGGLLLRAVKTGVELEYMTLSAKVTR